MKVHPQYVVDDHQKPTAVLLSLKEWEHILEELEELEDVRAVDQASAHPQEAIPFERAVREIEEGYES